MTAKIFVVSLHRTMTRSTDILLSMLGYRTLHFPKFFAGQNLMEAIRGMEADPERVVDTLTPVIEDRDALSDVPIPGLYQVLARRWPDSRFVLVTRDADRWAESVHGHMKDRSLSPFNHVQYRPYLDDRLKRLSEVSHETLAAVHRRHTEAVRRFFEEDLKQPGRLCVVPIAAGDAGEQICRFLGHDPRPLPRLSGRASDNDRAVAREWTKACPGKSDAHYMLATNLLANGEREKALSHLKRAVAAEPDQPKPYAVMAEILAGTADTTAAGEAARNAIDQGMRRPRLFKRAARGELAQGHVLAAIRLGLQGGRYRHEGY